LKENQDSLEEQISEARRRMEHFRKKMDTSDVERALLMLREFSKASAELSALLESQHARRWRLLLAAFPEIALEASLSHIES
jgi:hypothetical protein